MAGGTPGATLKVKHAVADRLVFTKLRERFGGKLRFIVSGSATLSQDVADFFHAVSAEERRGLHPRWLYREQSYWTPVGVEGGTTAALLNEEGLVEPDRGSFSLEPFWFADDELVTWADVELEQSLAQGELPIPSVTWRPFKAV